MTQFQNKSPHSLTIIFEKSDDELWGRIESSDFFLSTVGKTKEEVVENLKESLEDFILHEGRGLEFWKDKTLNDFTFDFQYDLAEFFNEYQNILKVRGLAQLAGLNPSLLSQYSNGITHPSYTQIEKIENAIKELANSLLSIKLRLEDSY